MALLEFENVDFLSPVRPNLVPKSHSPKILMKIGKMNN